MIDFSKKLKNPAQEKKTDPIEIYNSIDRKSITGPLRSAQERILKSWYKDLKDEKDLIIKLHTGVGKTLIGLLILQSKLNSGEGPCLYVCPDKYLAEQVKGEAQKFGINFCDITDDNDLSDDFINKKSILVTYAAKVFNGKSIFGVNRSNVRIGTIILDDAHTCSEKIQESFCITLNADEDKEIYSALLNTFEEDLQEQGAGDFLDILDGKASSLMLVPYWSWVNKSNQTLSLLNKYKESSKVFFAWEFIKNRINDYSMFISGKKIEIVPRYSLISAYSFFKNASNRILMSATTQNDAFFITGLGLSIDAVKNPLTDEQQLWYGEKMFLIPSLMCDDFHDDTLIDRLMRIQTEKFGVVCLVASKRIAQKYCAKSAIFVNDDIVGNLNKLKSKQFSNKYVIANRYDGLDFPDEYCRILIVDGKPYYDSLADRYDELCRANSEIILRKTVQKIEQAFGRSVRGEKDYSAIIILSSELVKFVRNNINNGYMSSQTKKQIELAIELANSAKSEYKDGDSIDTIFEKTVIAFLQQLLNRDEGWKQYYEQCMMDIDNNDNTDVSIYSRLSKEAQIQELMRGKEYEKSADLYQEIINSIIDDDEERGWYLQQLASVKYFYDKVEANKIQQAAFRLNCRVLKPHEGIYYEKISLISESRISRIIEYCKNFSNNKDLMLEINDIVDNLVFGNESEKFEDALYRLGQALGFNCQRPDKIIRKGPDVLWAISENEYIMFECKNEVSEDRRYITKTEAGQMNNHIGWFKEEYSESKVTGIMIIPTKQLAYDANFTGAVKIIRKGILKDFRDKFNSFYLSLIKKYDVRELSVSTIHDYLNEYSLDIKSIKEYNESYIKTH